MKDSDRFDYRPLAKFVHLVILAFGFAGVVFSFHQETFTQLWYLAWPPRLLGLAFIASCISYPSAIEIRPDFFRVHYLFGAWRTFAYEEVDFAFHSMTLFGRVRGNFLKRVTGSFSFVLEIPLFVQGFAAGPVDLVPRSERLLDTLASRTRIAMNEAS